MSSFNPYERWLGIKSSSNHPNYFVLLNIDVNEYRKDIIKQAAKNRLKQLEPFKEGKHARAYQTISNRVKRAYKVLVDPLARADYLTNLAQEDPLGFSLPADSPNSSLSQPKNKPTQALSSEKATNSIFGLQNNLAMIALAVAGLLLIIGAIGFVVFNSGSGQSQQNVAQSNSKDQGIEDGGLNIAAKDRQPTENQNLASQGSSSQTDSEEKSDPTPEPVTPAAGAEAIAHEKADDHSPATPQTSDSKKIEIDEELIQQIKDIQTVKAESDEWIGTLNIRAKSVLSRYCAQCHFQSPGKNKFNSVLNWEELVQAGYIVPGKPAESTIVSRLLSDSNPMPPKQISSRPTEADIKILVDWIDSGAERYPPSLLVRLLDADGNGIEEELAENPPAIPPEALIPTDPKESKPRKPSVQRFVERRTRRLIDVGLEHVSKRDFDSAHQVFQAAVDGATDNHSKRVATEYLIPFVEKDGGLDEILKCYELLLSQAEASDVIELTVNQLFGSVKRLESSQRNFRYEALLHRSHHSPPRDLPLTTTQRLSSFFNKRYVNDKSDEAALFGLTILYRYVIPNPQKLNAFTIELGELRLKRGNELKENFIKQLVLAYDSKRNYAKSASLQHSLAIQKGESINGVWALIGEANSWLKAGQQEQLAKTLALAKTWLFNAERDRAWSAAAFKIADLYTSEFSEYEVAQEIFDFILDNSKAERDIAGVRTRVAKLKRAGLAQPESEEELDPIEYARRTAEDAETALLNQGKNPSELTVIKFKLIASEAWLDANEKNKSKVALKIAERSYRRLRPEKRTEFNEQFARLYIAHEENQKALDCYVELLRIEKGVKDAEIQMLTQRLLEKDKTLRLSAVDELMLDPNREQAILAQDLEAKSDSIDSIVEAAEIWGQIDRFNDFLRCVDKAEALVSQANSATYANQLKSKPLTGSLKLARLCEEHGEYQTAVRLLVNAMRLDASYNASRHYTSIKLICEKYDTELPVLSDELTEKLDPLSVHRKTAIELELKAASSDEPDGASNYLKAAEEWVKAKESAKAVSALNKYGRYLLDQQESLGKEFGIQCETVAEFFEQVGENRLARDYYTFALETESNNLQKKRIQSLIDALGQ